MELHIEQGPRLEREGVQLGIVSAIAAPAALRVFFSGDGGHAGALLMPDRHASTPTILPHGMAILMDSIKLSTSRRRMQSILKSLSEAITCF